MTAPVDGQAKMSAFLVERYLPPQSSNSLAASVARLARLCADSGSALGGVQYVQSAHIPGDDTCFCLFRADSAEAVRAINAEAAFAFDRLTEAILLFDDPPPASPGAYPDYSHLATGDSTP